jgi:hypothetical protein
VLERNLAALSDLRAWARRALRELRFRRPPVVRLHASGDVFSVAYARALLFLMHALPDTRFLLYSRSWRVPRLRPWLDRMAALPNVSVWFSVDGTTGLPRSWPERVRLAWLALDEVEQAPWACADDIRRCHLVFLDQPLRRSGLTTFAGVPVCPQEYTDNLTCETCRRCL